MTKSIYNLELYRKLDVAFPNLGAASGAIEAFCADLRVLREKYKLPDLYWIARVTTLVDGDSETVAYSHGGHGNVLEWEAMLAYALGVEQADRQQRIGELLTNAGAIKRKRAE